MAINYKIYKNTNQKSDAYNKYFGRVVTSQTVGTEKLSELIQENVSAKESDVYAVLKELKNAIRTTFNNGNAVKIEGLGTFRPSARSQGVTDPNDFTASNFYDYRILFRPETTSHQVQLTRTVGDKVVTIKTRVTEKKLLKDLSFQEATNYTSPRTKTDADTQQGDTTNP